MDNMVETPGAWEQQAETLARYFVEAEGEQIVRDIAAHVGDELHGVLKRHGMTMASTAGSIGMGVLAASQVLNDTIEFARRSLDDEAERAAVLSGIGKLFLANTDPALGLTLLPASPTHPHPPLQE